MPPPFSFHPPVTDHGPSKSVLSVSACAERGIEELEKFLTRHSDYAAWCLLNGREPY